MNEIFFDRAAYWDILKKRVSALKEGYRQNLAVIGDELIGKTSIIFNFLNKFSDNHIVMLYLEARPESLNTFAKRFIGVLLYNFLLNSNTVLKEDLPSLIKESEKYIPKTADKIKSILSALKKGKKNNVFSDLLSLCDILHEETGKFCVVIFDEFQNLESMGLRNLYQEWSKLLITQKTTLYIIVSSMKFKAKTILNKNLSLLFGNFETINIEAFSAKTSSEYLKAKLKEKNIPQGLINFIVHFTGGSPFYLSIISDALFKLDQQDFSETLVELLFEPTGALNQRFTTYLKRFSQSPNSQDYLAILQSISIGQNRLKDISRLLNKPKEYLIARMNYLLELDIVSRFGDFLAINDRVFGFWLRFVYQEKLLSLTFDAKNQKAVLKANLEKMLQEFLLTVEKPVLTRMQELLLLFEDEVMQIDKKKIKLCRFREIKPLNLKEKNLSDWLIGRSQDSLWIMAFKRDVITEDDITEFSRECKKYRHKLQRKILITFQTMDPNARLKALEEKILTWDLNNLNNMLDLYSKPRIIA